MAKQKKTHHIDIPPVPREAIAAVRVEEDFVELLRRELEWPIPMNVERLADVSIPHDLQSDFGFKPEEERIAVSRLLNLAEDQPWGVFLFEFKTKRPYLSHLRRLLRVLGSQRTQRRGDPIWNRSDLLFICTPDWRQFQFVHFSGEKPESALISAFGWKGPDDPFLHTLCRHNLPRLRMPQPEADGTYNQEGWRNAWRDAFSVKPVTDEFYRTLKEVFDAVQAGVKGLKGDDRRFFAELIVNRMLFLKFVEKKGWLDEDRDYLYNRFQAHGRKNFWRNFLSDLFFEGLCKEKDQRAQRVNDLLGEVPFLNAELFAPSDKWDDRAVEIENRVFDLLFDKLLNPYNFTVCETSPLDMEVAFNQDLLGYGYEELIADQHGQGAYYTHPTEVNLMCRESIRACLEGRCPDVSKDLIGKLVYAELTEADPVSEKEALVLYRALHDVTVVDPALGSGTFPVAMMKHIFLAMRTLGTYLRNSAHFAKMVKEDGVTPSDDPFHLKLHIIERSIYGCDIDYFAVQIAKLRFWIELMVDCDTPEALPNFNCKLVVGDALVSVVGTDRDGDLVTLEQHLGHPTRSKGQSNLIHDIGKQAVNNIAKLKAAYFKVRDADQRKALEVQISKARDDLLGSVGINLAKLKRTDKHVLWQIDFAEIFAGEEPGFDIAIANPPYLRSEQIDALVKNLINKTYSTLFTELEMRRKCDLYVYFYLRATMVTRRSGIICFICSNSWLDIGYGRTLQLHFLTTTRVLGIYESAIQRSFSGADVNTAITIFKNAQNREEALNHIAKFVMFSCTFAQVNLGLINEICSERASCEHNMYRLSAISQSQALMDGHRTMGSRIFLGDKWGGRYLRSPIFFQRMIEEKREILCRLGDFCTIIGYIHDNNTGPSYPEVAFLKSVKDVQSIWVTKKSPGVIRFGVSPNGNSRVKAPILFPRTFGTRHIIVWNPEGIYGKEFYKIIPPKGEELVVMSQLASSLGMLQRELIGVTNLGDGALKFSGDDLELFWLTRSIPIDALKEPFHKVSQRVAYDYEKELSENDRRHLDKIIFDALGIPNSIRAQIYIAVEQLITNRLKRAGSMRGQIR
jgi:hypothetical protein